MWGGNKDSRTSFHKGRYWEDGKILNSTYTNTDLEQVSTNATQLNYEERTKLLGIIKDF